LIKDVPSLRSFACTLDSSNGLKDVGKQIKGKLTLEKAYNKDKIMMPHDSRGLVLLYGGVKEAESRRKKSIEDCADILDYSKSTDC
jgi:hypothetical protein